jgi:hypothetical protein
MHHQYQHRHYQIAQKNVSPGFRQTTTRRTKTTKLSMPIRDKNIRPTATCPKSRTTL